MIVAFRGGADLLLERCDQLADGGDGGLSVGERRRASTKSVATDVRISAAHLGNCTTSDVFTKNASDARRRWVCGHLRDHHRRVNISEYDDMPPGEAADLDHGIPL